LLIFGGIRQPRRLLASARSREKVVSNEALRYALSGVQNILRCADDLEFFVFTFEETLR
jgi:hypothetical protein